MRNGFGSDDTLKYYNENSQEYAEASKHSSFEKIIVKFLDLLPSPARVIDVGCGGGRDSAVFCEKEADVIGLDISSGLLEEARKDHPDVEFIEANFLELPIESETVDGVWSHASLVHLETIEDVKKALSEFYRVLKPDGFLYVYVKAQCGNEETAVVSDKLSNHDRFFRYYTPRSLSELLSEAGFAVGGHELHDDLHGREEVKWIQFIVQKIN